MKTIEKSTTEYYHVFKDDSGVVCGGINVLIDNINSLWKMELNCDGKTIEINRREFIEDLKEFLIQAQKIKR